MDSNQLPHPERNPSYSKADYIRNAVFAVAKIEFGLYIGEGASLHEAAHLAQHLQECIHRAYHVAIQEAGIDITSLPPEPPQFGEGLSDDNPFNT
jgi:hypothetical protein